MLTLESNVSGIYQLTNRINGKIYVGKAINLKNRIRSYQTKISPRSHHPITLAILKYGWENFEVIILESFPDITNEELLKREAEWIKKLDATNREKGYNVAHYSNDISGTKMSPEFCARISQIKKELCNGVSPFAGKKHTIEAKQKLSAHAKTRLGNKNPFYGKSHSEDTLRKIREKRKKQDMSFKWKPVKQVHAETREVIKIWPNASQATVYFTNGKTKNPISIKRVCLKKPVKDGKGGLYTPKTCYGFVWEYV